jgi:hypothetical protein
LQACLKTTGPSRAFVEHHVEVGMPADTEAAGRIFVETVPESPRSPSGLLARVVFA